MMLIPAGILLAPVQALATDSELGISLQVLQGREGGSENLNKNNRLWFVIEPGKSDSRDFIVHSASEISQKIQLSIGGRSQLNGELRYDSNAVSVADEWATFSTNDFLLKPGQSRQVRVSITVPQDAAVEVLQPTLLVKSVATVTKESTYKIPTAMQISQGIFLGVGTDEDFRTSFVIDDVFGQNGDSGKTLQVKISNTGKTPIAILGDVQLSSAPFFETTIGPLGFTTPTINPGESGFGEIAVGDEVQEDRYRILVRGTQGFITETREFEKDIDFRGLAQLYNFLIWGAIILISLVVALFSLRILRSSTPSEPGNGKTSKDFPFNRTPKSTRQQEPVFEPVSGDSLNSAAASQVTRFPEASALIMEEDKPFVEEPKLEPQITFELKPEPETLSTVSTQEPLTVNAEAIPKPSFKNQWKLPKLKLPPIPKLQLPTWKIPRLPKVKFPNVDFSAASKALLDALPKPKTRPAAAKITPATEAQSLETQRTSTVPAPSKPAGPNVRPTGSGKPTASPGTNLPGSGPRPLYPYWYQPPNKGSSNKI
jgi:hypothetical protein